MSLNHETNHNFQIRTEFQRSLQKQPWYFKSNLIIPCKFHPLAPFDISVNCLVIACNTFAFHWHKEREFLCITIMRPDLQNDAIYHSILCHFAPIVWYVKIRLNYMYMSYFSDQEVKPVEMCKHKSDGQAWTAWPLMLGQRVVLKHQ
jgi:hypothetical protein